MRNDRLVRTIMPLIRDSYTLRAVLDIPENITKSECDRIFKFMQCLAENTEQTRIKKE